MSVLRELLLLMSLCVAVFSCVKDPDPSGCSAPEILSTSMSVEGAEVRLLCKVSRSDNITGCGFCFGTSEENMRRFDSELSPESEFSAGISGLTYGVRYLYRSFVTGGTDTLMSATKMAEIDRQTPSPSIISLTLKDLSTVVCEYSVADNFSGEMVICGLCWNETGSPTIQSEGKTLDGSEYGSRRVEVGGLGLGRTYHFRVYAVNGEGTAYSEEMKVEIPFGSKAVSEYLLSVYDTDSDGSLSLEEASRVTVIDACSDGAYSLKGIEYLPNLATLRCRGSSYGENGGSGGISDVDLSANPGLVCLDLSNNRLDSLDLSRSGKLTSLSIGGNIGLEPEVLSPDLPFIQGLVSLDISGCPNLGYDLSMFPSLEEFHYDSRTGVKDVEAMFRQKRSLRRLYAGDALREEDKIYLLSSLEVLDCQGSSLQSIDLAYNPELKSLNMDGCDRIARLCLSANRNITELHCMCEGLKRLELLEGHEIDGINTNLGQHRHIPESVEIVYVPKIGDEVFLRFLLDNYDSDNDSSVSLGEAETVESMTIPANEYPGIASLHGIGMFTSLKALSVCGQRGLKELDLSGNRALVDLVCDNSSIETLDIAKCASLRSLFAQGTSLSSLDLSANAALESAYLSRSPLKTLVLGPNPNLKTLSCDNCSLETLDISSCNALERLDCTSSSLKTLYLTGDQKAGLVLTCSSSTAIVVVN